MNTVATLNPQTYAQPLNHLERAGWAAVAAERFAICPAEASVLRELVLASGRYVGADYLAGQIGGPENTRTSARLRLSVRVSRIRKALQDLGLPPCAIENDREAGYAIAPHHARRVRSFVEAGE